MGTTLLLAAVLLCAQPAQAAVVPELTDAVNETLRKLPLEPPPQLPEVQLPELPLPTPVPEAPPLPPVTVPPPVVPDPPPAVPDPPRAAEPAPAPAGPARAAGAEAEVPAPAQGDAGRPVGDTRQASPGTGRTRATPRRTAPRRASSRGARRAERDRGAARRGERAQRAGARVEPAPAFRPAGARTVTQRAPAGPPSFASRVADEVGEIIRTMPAAILWALVASATIALGLAGNAFRQSRRRKTLEAQRAELLDDIGLLSGALLPPVPERLDGVAVSVAYRPADGPAAGGDFYDVFEIEQQRVGVLLGDVSGHGRQSVRQAALARYTLRTLLAAGHAPGEALARADELLARELGPNFVTVIACVLDRGELTYAKAGHAPPIVLGADHDPEAEQPAPPIGLGFGDVWPEYSVEIREGVSVCLFTDGLEDARIGTGRVGRDEVVRLLAAQEVPSAGRLIGDLEDLAELMSDDAAAVVLSYAAPVGGGVAARAVVT